MREIAFFRSVMELKARPSFAPSRYSQNRSASGDGGVRLDPNTLPDLLFQLGEGDLVFRGGGVSLFRRVAFDHFRAKEGMRFDRISGVSLQPDLIRQVVLVPEGISPLRIEVEFSDTGNSFTFYPAVAADSPMRMRLLEEVIDDSELSISHPEDWLGDGIRGGEGYWKNRLVVRESRFLSGLRVQLNMRSGSCAMAFELHVTWIDLEERLYRLSGPEGIAVVHFDATSSSLEVDGLPLLSPLIETCFR